MNRDVALLAIAGLTDPEPLRLGTDAKPSQNVAHSPSTQIGHVGGLHDLASSRCQIVLPRRHPRGSRRRTEEHVERIEDGRSQKDGHVSPLPHPVVYARVYLLEGALDSPAVWWFLKVGLTTTPQHVSSEPTQRLTQPGDYAYNKRKLHYAAKRKHCRYPWHVDDHGGSSHEVD